METTVQQGQIVFTHSDGKGGNDHFTVRLHRTLRLPEDGRTHALPPSLGSFPIKRVEDYADKVPAAWNTHGGVFIPMWQREAMWLGFHSSRRPFVTKVAAGKINAVSGKPWTSELAPSDNSGSGDPRQDYLVAPPQPWLDGFNSGNGIIKQFVSMPLGQGYTVEGQVTGKEDFGGIQIMAVPPKVGLLMPRPRRYGGGILRSRSRTLIGDTSGVCDFSLEESSAGPIAVSGSMGETKGIRPQSVFNLRAAEMGLAAGGSMDQKIYPDPHGIDTWDVNASGRLFIHIVNSEMYQQITGETPPASPVTAQTYAQHGYPWYKLWDAEMGDVSPSQTLAGVKTIGQKDAQNGFTGQQDDSPVYEKNVVGAGNPILLGQIKDGVW